MKILLIISLLVSFVFSSNLALATNVIKGNKVIIKLPETIDESFVVQIYRQIQASDGASRIIKLASEVMTEGSENETIEIISRFNETYYFYLDKRIRLNTEHYVRIIKADSLKYKSYSVTSFTPQPANTILLENLVAENNSWNTINFSKNFTFEITEGNPLNDIDYSANLAGINGLPKSYHSPFKGNMQADWAYQVKGIYYLSEGEDRYSISTYMKRGSKVIPYGSQTVHIGSLIKHDFKIVDEYYYGD